MSKELDLAGMAAASGWIRLRNKRANVTIGSPCQNCQTKLEGPYCHVCGQFAQDFHRSIWVLCAEFIESFFHLDGRVWHTLPNLIFRPGRLTRSYLDGRRIVQIPPFRMFIVFLFLLLLVGQYVVVSNGTVELGMFKKIHVEESDVHGNDVSLWLKERIDNVRKDPERFLMVLEIWGYRVAVLALPMMAFLLTILFMFQRRFYVYDHLVFSIHSITFHFMLLTTILALSLLIGPLAWWLALASPVHLWCHMRHVYKSSIIGTIFRQLLLGVGTFFGFLLLAVLWIFIGVNAMS